MMKILIVSINDLSSMRGPRFSPRGLMEKIHDLGCDVLEEKFCLTTNLHQEFVWHIVKTIREQGVNAVFCDTPIPLLANKIQERALLKSDLSKIFLATKVWEEAINCPVLFIVDPADTGTKAYSLGEDFFKVRAHEIEEWQQREKKDALVAVKHQKKKSHPVVIDPEELKNFRWRWRNFPATPDKLAVNEMLRDWIWAARSGQTLTIYERNGTLDSVSDPNSRSVPVPVGFLEKSAGNGSLEKILEILK